MFEDDRLHDAPHTSRAHLADVLNDRRAEVANDIVARLRRADMVISPLIARTLVHELSIAIAQSAPDVVVHWSRMVRHAHPAAVVAAMIEAGCEAAEELAHAELGDLATIVSNHVQPKDASTPAFDILTTPTPLQQRALNLLQVSL
jgi:hypothetical protein